MIGSLALGLVVLLPWLLLGIAMRRGLRRLTNQRTSSGAQIRPTFMSYIGLGNVSPDVNLIARIGSQAKPVEALNGKILRPTVGVRLISIGLSLALI